MVVSAATLPEYDCSWCRSTVSCLCAILGPMSEAAMSSFTWKRPRDLETQQGRETPQDLETRYEGADIEPASLAAWRLLMEQVISSADPAIAFIGFLQTMQALPERPLSQPRVFVSHRMADVPYAGRIADVVLFLSSFDFAIRLHVSIPRHAAMGANARRDPPAHALPPNRARHSTQKKRYQRNAGGALADPAFHDGGPLHWHQALSPDLGLTGMSSGARRKSVMRASSGNPAHSNSVASTESRPPCSIRRATRVAKLSSGGAGSSTELGGPSSLIA